MGMKKGIRMELNGAEPAKIYLSGGVISDINGEWEKLFGIENGYITPADVIDELEQIPNGTDIEVHINSNGGDVQAGLAIANLLEHYRKGKVVTFVDGWAASIASIIALAGSRCVMPANTYLMIHYPSCVVAGNINDLRKGMEDLEKITDGMIDEYTRKSITTREKIVEMLEKETWLTADECAGIFENVEVAESTELKAVAKIGNFKDVPAGIKAMIEADGEAERKIEESILNSVIA